RGDSKTKRVLRLGMRPRYRPYLSIYAPTSWVTMCPNGSRLKICSRMVELAPLVERSICAKRHWGGSSSSLHVYPARVVTTNFKFVHISAPCSQSWQMTEVFPPCVKSLPTTCQRSPRFLYRSCSSSVLEKVACSRSN